jgi:hypothetical protein
MAAALHITIHRIKNKERQKEFQQVIQFLAKCKNKGKQTAMLLTKSWIFKIKFNECLCKLL